MIGMKKDKTPFSKGYHNTGMGLEMKKMSKKMMSQEGTKHKKMESMVEKIKSIKGAKSYAKK